MSDFILIIFPIFKVTKWTIHIEYGVKLYYLNTIAQHLVQPIQFMKLLYEILWEVFWLIEFFVLDDLVILSPVFVSWACFQ